MKTNLTALIHCIPEGSTIGSYLGRTYLVTKSTFNEGKSCKIFGRELGGSDFVSLNYYETNSDCLCKPCEMSEEKVLRFLKEFVPRKSENSYESDIHS